MNATLKVSALAALAVLALLSPSLRAQQQTPGFYPPARVGVVLERYQGDKKVASMPFSLWVTGGRPGGSSQGSLRIGVDVPVGSTTSTRGANGPGQTRSDTTTEPQYRSVGTSIDCYLRLADDAKYFLEVRLDDSSIFDPTAQRDAAGARSSAAPMGRVVDATAFRHFSFDNTLEMRDGESAEFVNATDKVTGEIVKAIVTLTIAK